MFTLYNGLLTFLHTAKHYKVRYFELLIAKILPKKYHLQLYC